jgi:hypothetical protein
LAKEWVRVRRVGTPRLRKGAAPEGATRYDIHFEVGPKPLAKWVWLFHEKVGPGRVLRGGIDEWELFPDGYRGYVKTASKDDVAKTLATLDELIDDTNDTFEAFWREVAAEAQVAQMARLEAERQKHIEEQAELDAIAEEFAKPPYEP